MSADEDLVFAALRGDVAAARAALDGGADFECIVKVRRDVWLFARAHVSAVHAVSDEGRAAQR